MKSRFATGTLTVILSAMMVVAFGCSDDDEMVMGPTPPPNMGNGAQVRVIHASTDAGPVDVYAEGVAAPLIQNLAYGQTSDYLDVAAGTYNIQLRPAGALASSTPAFETGNLTLADGDKITALAAGLLNSTAADDKFRVLPLAESFASAGAGNAIVRVVHASSDAPTVAIDVGNDGTPEISSLARFAATDGAGVALPANTALQIAIWAGAPLSRVTVFTTPQLPEGAEIFVIATGLLTNRPRGGGGFSLLAVAPTGTVGFIRQNPVVFALHASPDAPNVDIYAGTAKLVDDLGFAELGGAIQVPPGSYALDFKQTGSTTTAATLNTPNLEAGEQYLAIASGFLLASGQPNFRLLPLSESFASNAGATVRVVHASPDAPPVDVGTVSGNTVTAVGDFKNLAFEDASAAAGTVLPVGLLPIGIAAAGTTTPVATFTVPTVAGLKAYAVAAGSYTGIGQAFRLVIVDATSSATGPVWTAQEIQPNP